MIVDVIFGLFRSRGEALYGGEAVSQTQHALQAAQLAERAGAGPTLVGAALLHDIGHLLEAGDEVLAGDKMDARHEVLGGDWLSRWFLPELAAPVRLHVAAKRYLCAANRGYFERLSPASRRSLTLQGGPMCADEAENFESHPGFRDALRLRSWDEAAKTPGVLTPDIAFYRSILTAALRR